MAKWNPEQVRFGNGVKAKLAENPDSFGKENGSSFGMNTGDNLDRQSRKAGDAVGIRAEEMETNPQVQDQSAKWWEAFKMSPNAASWKQSRLSNQGDKLGLPSTDVGA